MPKSNILLKTLSPKSQATYIELVKILDDNEKKQFEKEINNIRRTDQLTAFLTTRLQRQHGYKELLSLLPKSEHVALKEQIRGIENPEKVEIFIQKRLSVFQLLKNSDKEQVRIYSDLLSILPENQAIDLKEQMVQCVNQKELTELLNSKLPETWKALESQAISKLLKLGDSQRRKILARAIQKQQTLIPHIKDSGIQPQASESVEEPGNIVATKQKRAESADEIDKFTKTAHASEAGGRIDPSSIEGLLEEIKDLDLESLDDSNTLPSDDWGEKFPLEGEERKAFFDQLTINFLRDEDRQTLKTLFNAVTEDRVLTLLGAYYTAFDEKEQIDLLGTMIYLYRCMPSIAIKMCNSPKSLTTGDKLTIFKKTDAAQRTLLHKLDEVLG